MLTDDVRELLGDRGHLPSHVVQGRHGADGGGEGGHRIRGGILLGLGRVGGGPAADGGDEEGRVGPAGGFVERVPLEVGLQGGFG